MGNSMLKPLKTKSEHIITSCKDKVGDSFDKNKKAIKGLNLPFSKKSTNKMAGYITRMEKRKKKEKGN